MTPGARPTVFFVLPDARRLGFQLRMNLGGTYLEQVRLAVAMLEEQDDDTDDDGTDDDEADDLPAGTQPG